MSSSASPFPASNRQDCLADCYCAVHDVDPTQFIEHLFRRSLYPHARVLRPVLEVLAPGAFRQDREFIAALAHLRSRRDFPPEANDYFDQSRRERKWRHRLRLRVSAERARRVIWNLPREKD